MKKGIFAAAGIIALVMMFFSCGGLAAPKKIQVIAKPEINAGLGETEQGLKDFLSISMLREIFAGSGSAEKIQVYNYLVKKDVQTYLAYYPIADVSLDLNEYLEKANFDEEFKVDFEETFSVPKIEFDKSVSLPKPSKPSGAQISIPVETELEVNIPSDGGLAVCSIEITDGFLDIQPSGNIKLDPQGLNLGGDMLDKQVEGKAQPSGTVRFDLSGRTLTVNADPKKNKLVISGSVGIDTSGSQPSKIELKLTGGVGKVGKVTLAVSETLEGHLVKVVETDVSDMAEVVESIAFNRLGAEGAFSNNLPQGNDLSISVVSDSLKLTGGGNFSKTAKIEAGVNNREIDLTADNIAELKPSDLPDKKITFKVNVGLPGYDAVSRTAVFTGITMGKEYRIGGSLNPVFGWESVTVRMDSGAGTGAFKGEYGGIDLSALKENLKIPATDWSEEKNLADEIELSGIQAYLYISVPEGKGVDEVFKNLKAEGQVSVEYDGKKDPILSGAITYASRFPVFYREQEDYKGTLPEPSETFDMSKIFNAYPSDLSFNYDINMAGQATVTKKQLDEIQQAGGTATVGAGLVIEIPLRLKLKNDSISMVLEQQGSGNKDILGRDSGTELNEDMKKLFNAFKEVVLTVDYANDFNVGASGKITIPKAGAAPYTSEFFSFKQGKNRAEIKLSAADVRDYILENYPCNPKIMAVLTGKRETDGVYVSIPQDAGLKASVRVSAGVSIDGVYDFTSGKWDLK